MANYIKLEWKNSCDLGRILYSTADTPLGLFKNKLFLDTEIGEPDYLHSEDGHDNGDGVFIKEIETLVKNYRFKVVVPEDIADALEAMALHDTITLTYTNGLYSSNIRNVKVNTTWEENSNQCLAIVEVIFEQDDQVVKGSCCD
ncbi:MAG: hypothetical protein V4549_06400 [Bacteroidota bacterium]